MTEPDSATPSTRGQRWAGAGMIVAAWVLALAGGAALFGGWLEHLEQPNRDLVTRVEPDGVREVVLAQNRAGHYVAPGLIDGVPVVFLLDTGATNVTVPGDLAERIGLRRGRAVSTRTANGTITTWLTRLDQVELGEIVMTNVRAHINPRMHGREVLLGMSFLRRLR